MAGADPRDNPLAQAHRRVQEAEKARLAGKLRQAATICADLLKRFPDYVAALHTMGLILADQSKYQEALGYLHRASMLFADNPQTLVALSGVYLRLGAAETAATTLERARKLAPDDVTTLATLGEIYREEKEYELSKEAFQAALQIDPSFEAAEIGLALDLVHMGQLKEAGAIFEKAVNGGSREVSVLYNLSQLPSSLISVKLIDLIEDVTASPKLTAEEARIQVAFTKAAVFDKAKRFDEAWEQLLDARRLRSEETRLAYESTRRRYAPLLKLARAAPSQKKPHKDQVRDLPVSLFITAPSRSGKTTLEHLLGTLPGVKKGYENPIVENAVSRCFQASGLPTRSHLVELPAPLGDQFREYYNGELAKRSSGAKVLTNTIPARLEDALRAGHEIRNSRFVFVKRDQYDTAFRIFMRHYREGNEHSIDLRYTMEYVEWSHQMMDAAAAKMPQISRIVTYEEIVSDPRSTIAKVADLCNIEFSEVPNVSVGDDRRCSDPYRDQMESLLQSGS